MSDSGQKFIKRNRAPRVHITYEDPYDADRLVELPFVMGVLADLSGNNAGTEKEDIAERKFLDFDMDNFDSRMAAIQPGAKFNVANTLSGDGSEKLSVDLRFNKMDDFKPAAIARQVPALAKLLEAREQLKNLQLYMDGKAEAEAKLRALLNDPELMAALQQRMAKDPGGDA
jgi:type VI secretion system protein ImpB